MLKAFYQIDLFGKAVLFNYKGNSKSKSKVGAIFTIILFAFVIWVTIYFGQKLLSKNDPKATYYQSFNENPTETPITTDNFVFAIGMADPVTFVNYINESIFTVHASTYKAIRTPHANGTVQITYEQTPLELETCTTDHFGELAEQFSYLSLNQIYCLKKEQPSLETDHPILQGNFESPVFQSIYVYFQECDPTTSTVHCGTQEERDKLLKGGYLSLVYSNIAVDMTDRKKPLKKFRDGTYTTVDNAYYKELTLYLEQLEINTDNGWLTTNYETEGYIKFGEIREFLSLTPKSYFAYFSMRLSNVKKHYNRSYTKIQDILAQVNGIVTVTFTILFIVLAPYARLKFYETLINEIFDIKTSKRNPKGKSNRRKSKQNKDDTNDPKKAELKKEPKPANKLKITTQIDLEEQRPPLKLNNDPVLTTRIELTDRRDTDDVNLIRRTTTVEEYPSTHYNFAAVIQSPSLPFITQIQNLDTEMQESKQKISIPHSRGPSGIPFNFSAIRYENRLGNNSEMTIPISSPIDSKRDRILISKKPTFTKPHFKILDYEEHGQDLFEDILKNIHSDKKKEDDDIADEFAISEIQSEENVKGEIDPTDNKTRKDHKERLPDELQGDNQKEEKEQNEKEIDRNEAHAKYKLQRLDLITSKNMDEIELSFWEYVRSYFSKSDVIKRKMRILDEGIKRINERLDIFNIFKKLREFDKLKVLLLENEQFVLFDSLPKPELSLKEKDTAPKVTVLSQKKIKDPQFIQDKIKKDLILLSYENLKRKSTSTMLDKRLFEIYDDFLCLKQ